MIVKFVAVILLAMIINIIWTIMTISTMTVKWNLGHKTKKSSGHQQLAREEPGRFQDEEEDDEDGDFAEGKLVFLSTF